MTKVTFESVEEAIEDIRQGKMVVVVDDENRENEGDLVGAGEAVTPEMINFMARFGRGLICTPLTEARAAELDLFPMVSENTDNMRTAFTVSVDGIGTSTGISAGDRAATIRALVSADTRPHELRRPGHIFPLVAREGGVLRRAGHTEAAVDLARLAGLKPVGVICEIMKDDGTMARVPDLRTFADEHGLKMVTIEALIRYRRKREKLIEKVAESTMPLEQGIFSILAYREVLTDDTHLALVLGDVTGDAAPLIRIHSQCLTGDVFRSLRCDCGGQLHESLDLIQQQGRGVLLYMRQEGRGIGLVNKLRAYALQDDGLDTVEANESLGFSADLRDYGIGAQILKDLGVTKLRLLTNNPRKVVGLEGYGLEVVERVPVPSRMNPMNERYLKTKHNKLGHKVHIHERSNENNDQGIRG